MYIEYTNILCGGYTCSYLTSDALLVYSVNFIKQTSRALQFHPRETTYEMKYNEKQTLGFAYLIFKNLVSASESPVFYRKHSLQIMLQMYFQRIAKINTEDV